MLLPKDNKIDTEIPSQADFDVGSLSLRNMSKVQLTESNNSLILENYLPMLMPMFAPMLMPRLLHVHYNNHLK